jgi:hypothetical protein
MRLTLTIAFLLYVIGISSQPIFWEPMPHEHSTNGQRDFIYSENLGLAIYCGVFVRSSADYYFAGYDGNDWVVLQDSVSGSISTLVDYENGILVGGQTTYVGDQHMPHMAYYENGEWSYPYSFDGFISKLRWCNDTLFALGAFDEVDGNTAYRIAKLAGGTWVGVLDESDDISFALFQDIEYYNGEYYVGGNFQTENGPNDFAKLIDGQLVEVSPDFISFGGTLISEMVVFQNELYLAGTIYGGEGLNAGNHLMKWDGSNFSKVGCEMFREPGDYVGPSNVFQLETDGEYLYCNGAFLYCDDFPMENLGRWDGEQWCSMHINSFYDSYTGEQPVRYLTMKEDTLMMYRFHQQNSIDPSTSFWKYTAGTDTENCSGPLSVTEPDTPGQISIYPNPSTGLITLESENRIQRIAVFDALGQLVYQENAQSQTQVQLDISHLPKGLYLVQVEGEGVVGSRKVVLE